MKKRLLHRLRGSGAQALAVAALLLTSAAGHAQTTAYCATGLGGACGGNDITAVGISGTTLNATGLTCTTANSQSYTAYPATGSTTATLSGGVPYTLSTTLSGQSIVSVWIDYNHNFVFEASEWTQVTTSSPTGTPVSAQILVPGNAVQGQTGMRVRSRSSGSANGAGDACTQFFSGETKDFTVTIGAPAACPAVSGLSVTGITGTNATVSFTPSSAATNYTVTATPTTGSPITQTGTGSPFTLTGLTANTAYTVTVVGNCGASGSSAASSASFTTTCGAAPYVAVNNTTPYTQDFETAWLSQCGTNEIPAVNWRNTPVTGNNSWRRDDDGASAAWTGPTSGAYTPAGSNANGASSTHSARFHTYNATSGSTGMLDLYVNMAGTSGTPVLNFDHINTSGTDSLKVYISTNGGASFALVPGAAFTTAATWTRRQVVLPAGTTATTVIRLLARSDFGTTDIGLDNVTVSYVACPPIGGASISNITATGATLNFTPVASAGSYTVTVTPAGGTASTVTPAPTGSPVALTGLTASTAYTVTITGNCGTNTSTATTLTFTTACAAAPYALVNNTTPYTQDFEATWLSQCGTNDVPGVNWRNTPVTGNNSWRRDDDGASAAWTGPTSGAYTPAGSNANGGTSTHSARFHTYNATSGSAGLFDLYVNMAGTAGTPTLSFDHINTSGTDSLKVYISTNGGASFALVPGAAFTTAATWTRRTINLPAGLTATTVIRLRARSDFGTTDIGVDNVSVSYITCPAVTAASISGITATSASLNFTPAAGSNSYTVTVTPAGGTATTQTATGSPVALTGLTASTAYTVSIVGNCGASTSSTVTLTFNTACTAAPYAVVNNTTPYTQDFEATWLSQCGTNDVPGVNWRNTPVTGNNSWRRDDDGASAAWVGPTSGAYTPTGSNANGASSAHSARFHSYNATSGSSGLFDLYVNMAGTLGAPTLSFDYINTSGTDSLAVLLSTNGGTTFSRSLLKLRTSSAWSSQTVALPTTGLTATTVIRFAATSDFGVTDIGLDNVRVSYISCPAVTGVSVSNVTTTTATVDFTPSPNGGSYIVTVTPSGGTATSQTVTTSPVNLTGLTASTFYTVSIVANCGAANGNSTATSVTFNTDCTAAPYALVNNTTPYTQDFEATWLSQCGTKDVPGVNWRNTPVTGNNSWRRDDDGASAAWVGPTSGAYTPAGSPLGSTSLHSARFHSYNASNHTTGQLDLYLNMAGTNGAPTLSFDYINTSGADSLKVYVSTDGGTTFGASLLKLRNAAAWTRQTVALPTTGLTATTVVRLLAISDFGVTDIGVDNLRVDYITCSAVTAATVTNTTATGATVNFTPAAGVSSYTLTVTPAGGTATTQTATGSPVTLTGLTASTAYTVSIVANCGGTNGNSAPTFVTFTTECAAAPYVLVNNSTPYTQDFEATWLSQCGTREIPAVNWRGKPVTGNTSWRRDDDGTSAAWSSTSGSYTPASSPVNGATGSHSARFHSYDATKGTSGQLDLYVNLAGTGAAAGLTFDYINTSGTDSLNVLVSTNGGSTFSRSLLKLTTATAWARQTVALPASAGATTIIRFVATGDFGTTDIGIDNVRVTYSACLPVSNLAATNVTSNGAQLSFTPPAGAPAGTTYEIEYGLQGFALGSGTKVTGLTAATYTLTNLTQSKDYCFYVRQNCGTANGSSSYAGPVCFSTPLPVPANDEPCGAVALGNTPTTSNNVGASTSTQNGVTLPTCSGAQLPKDVWFTFTATAASMPMTITGTAAGVVAVYSSPSCSAGPFTRVFCQAGPGNNQNVGALTITGLTAGTRYYMAVSGYGSGDTQGNFTIGAIATATKAQADTDALLVYPNPSNTGQLTLRLSGQTGVGQATLLNALGQVVATKNLSGTTEQTLSTRGLATGLYTLRVTVAGQVLTRKVVLE